MGTFGLRYKSVAACSLVSFVANSFSSLCVNANISSNSYDISTKKFFGGYKAQQVSKTNSGVVSSKSSYLRFLVKFFGVLILILASIYALLLFFKCKNEGNPENSKLNPVQKNEKENKQSFRKNNESKNSLIEIKGEKQLKEEPNKIIAKEDDKFEKESEQICQKDKKFESSIICEKKDKKIGVFKLKSKRSDCINKIKKGKKVVEKEIMLDNVEVDIDGDKVVYYGEYGWEM